MRLQVEMLLAETNKLLEESKKIYHTLSNGWASRFQKQLELKMGRVHGEAVSADEAGLAKDLPKTKAQLDK